MGFLGGTFDPPHVGHLLVAQDVVEGLDLDRLLVVPAGTPPHRQAVYPADQRLEFVRRAFAGDDRIDVSDVEVRRSETSYTVETLEWIRETMGPEELFCVIGLDQLRELGEWRDPERITTLARLVVMSRAGDEPQGKDAPPGIEFQPLSVTRVDLSSTRIRRRLRDGLPVRYLVPEAVREAVERSWPGG